MGNSCGRCLGNYSCGCCIHSSSGRCTMRDCFGCCPSGQAADSPPHRVVESEQAGETHFHPPLESDSPLSVESIRRSVEETDPIQQIEPLVNFIQNQLQMIKAKSKPSTSSSSFLGTDLENAASGTKLGAQVIDNISKAADTFEKTEIAKEMGNLVLSSVKAIAQTHWIFLGLSVVAFAMETCVKARSNVSECIELLEDIVLLAKDLNKFNKAMPAETEKLLKAVHVTIEGVVMCCDYIQKGQLSRYWSAGTMENQLRKTRQSIREITESLTLTGVTHIARYLTRRSDPSPFNLLEFQPVGIEKQISEVTQLLDMESSEPALAVILCGFGGIGKTTMAAAVIQQLDMSATPFKFCRVIIDEKTPDQTSHIIKLQKDIILDFGGDKMDLRDTADGRLQIQNVMENKCCFLFIDNVVEGNYIEQLLPRDLLPRKQSMEKTDSGKQKVRLLITSRTSNPRRYLQIKNVKEYRLQALSNDAANLLLTNTILQNEEIHNYFNEAGFISKVAEACRGVPLLLSVFGSHIRLKREEGMYQEALQALQKGDPDSFADDENLGQKLLFVYHQMKEEAQEAFLDICFYFHGWMEWDIVCCVVGNKICETLRNRMLVSKSESNNTVIVHDILRSMGRKEAKNTRLADYNDFMEVSKDMSKLKSVKGLSLLSDTSLTILKSGHLNEMHDSVRVLMLGDWVQLDGPPSDREFQNLRYLFLGNVPGFLFEDASKLKKLSVFVNRSKAGMNLTELPPDLKVIYHQLPNFDCNAFEKLPVQSLKALEVLHVDAVKPVKLSNGLFLEGARKSVKLPEVLKLPASLKKLIFNNCTQVPENFDHLTALELLILTKCDIQVLPRGFGKLVRLSILSIEFCAKLTSLSEGFGSLSSLIYLSLRGCTRLEELPSDLVKLTALKGLNVEECNNLRALPDGLGVLSSLQDINLMGCIHLQRLPDSFGRLRLRSLTLHSLLNLQELPQDIGNLACLLNFTMISCNSLVSLPDSFVQMEKLETLKIISCTKLGVLPTDFGRLSSLSMMFVKDCHGLKELPSGFQALPRLKILALKKCRSLVYLPTGFWKLTCLEELQLNDLSLSSLPAGFGMLRRLKELWIKNCCKLETLPNDFEHLVCLRTLSFYRCRMLEGAAMERIVKLQQCYFVSIRKSSKILEQWKEMQQKEDNYFMVVDTSSTAFVGDEEWQRAARVGLLGGQCKELNSSRDGLIVHSSILLEKNTTVAVIFLPIRIQSHHQLLMQRAVGMAMERSKRGSSGQLRMIHVRKIELDGEIPIDEDILDEDEKIKEVLMQLPEGSCAIPAAETRRLSLIQFLFFGLSRQQEVDCFMADINFDDKGRQIFVDMKWMVENDISGKIVQQIQSSDEVKNLHDLREDINLIYCERKREERGQCTYQERESIFNEAMKKNNIDHFIDSKAGLVTLSQLQGKTICLVMTGINTVECIKLQQIYNKLKCMDNNYLGIWIPLSVNDDYGYGAYRKATESMPWAVLPNPKLVNIKDKSPCFMIFDKGGRIVYQDILSLIMSWGANAYPFTQYKINEIISNVHNNSSASGMHTNFELEFLLAGMDFIGYQGVKVEKEKINKQLIIVYAEPPSDRLKMKSKLEQLVEAYGDFKILYVGYFSNEEQQDVDVLQELYEDITQKMQSWLKLSFEDTIMFWYRCKYLSKNEGGEQVTFCSTLKRLVRHLYIENKWLIFLDGDGIVTASGNEVVEMINNSNHGNDVEVNIMMDGMRESLKSGKCNQSVKTFFKDELSNHPQHPQHHLKLCSRQGKFFCDVCNLPFIAAPDQIRTYRCDDCNWDLCGECWEVFAKKQVQNYSK